MGKLGRIVKINRWRGRRLSVSLGAGLLALLALVSASFAAPQDTAAPSAFFPVAVWYGGGKARAPMLSPLDASSAAEWGQDLDQIKSNGFNTVKCWVDWSTAEPKRDSFNFDNLDLLLKLAEQRGLRVIVQIYTDSAPDWVGIHYPDGRFVDRSGAVVTSQSAPGYCIDHAGVQAEMVKFLQALSRDANRSAALYGWDVWSEPHVINWADFSYLANPEFCFCASSQARFRRWLQAKYKTLDALNAAWYRKFASWDEVQPPRFSTILSYTDYLDWRAFIDDKLGGDLKTRVDAIRSADHAHAITSHAAAPGTFHVAHRRLWRARRLEDVGQRRLLRYLDLPQALRIHAPLGLWDAGRRPRLYALRRAQLGQGFLDWRIAGGAGRDRDANRRPGDRARRRVLAVAGDRARRAGDRRLRMVSDEFGVRIEWLRPD